MEDPNVAITLDRDALALFPQGHPERPDALNKLAVDLFTRYNQLGEIADLNEAVVIHQEVLALRPPGHPDCSMSLNNLAVCLATRYKQLGATDDLDKATALGRDALALCTPGHPLRQTCLITLTLCLSTRHKQRGGMEDLDEAIRIGREAVALCLPGHPNRPMSLNNLAVCLSTRYKQLGGMEDLNEAILLDRDALVLRPPGHPDHSMSLNNLAVRLSNRYEQLGEIEDLSEAVVLNKDALMFCPPGHPLRQSCLINIGSCLSTRYNQLGAMEDLNEAILVGREAVTLCPPGHLNRPLSLNTLAACLSTRSKQLGTIEDLNEAIVLNRDTLALCSSGHSLRQACLINFALCLSTRYKQIGAMEDLDEAILHNREALALCQIGHPNRSTCLNNIAACLAARHKQLGRMEDLNEAILHEQEALALGPPGHPSRSMSLNNLAACLSTRYSYFGSMEDLNEAILLDRDALALFPPGHSNRSISLDNLAGNLHIRFTHSHQLDDKEELFNLYAQLADLPPIVYSTDLSAARAWICVAEAFHHPSTPLAYKTSLRLLIHHLAALPTLPQHFIVLKGLTSSLAVDAFSACLRNRSPTNAVELLEQGRGIFWSQLMRLRSPLDDVIACGPAGKTLADEFAQQTLLLRTALDSPGPGQHDKMFNLNIGLQKVVTNIRELPGLSHFLLSSPFSDLQQAACGGPVVIVNASDYGCDALVVSIDRSPAHIPLSLTRKDVRELSSKRSILTVRARSMDITREICQMLRELWVKVVSPIVDLLQTICPSHSRIWWCPTAEFSLLPLHAAGPYRKGQRNLAQFYISSYTPTLTALIRARRHDPPRLTSGEKRFLAIGQAKAAGERELPSVGTELAHIGQRMDGLATFTHIEGRESCIRRVTEALRDNEWVHLACHGIPNPKQPFESAFALDDGRFTIECIMRCELENPQFAYLSACHTTVGDGDSPDEVIHLAAAMQFAGFRSVIGTMWAVDDGETNEITSVFYDNMVDESGHLDHTRAASALNKMMRQLVNIPFDQRILYIHLGA